MKKYIKYFFYIIKHKWYVMRACFKLGLYWCGIVHDFSKFSIHEFPQYARWFFGSKELKCIDGSIAREFNYAWLHHQRKNKHHWEYWLLDGVTPLEIPGKYIKEMVCDWYGAGMSISGKNDIDTWYEKNKNKMIINSRNRYDIRKYVNILKKEKC